jgi:hypothetical protein
VLQDASLKNTVLLVELAMCSALLVKIFAPSNFQIPLFSKNLLRNLLLHTDFTNPLGLLELLLYVGSNRGEGMQSFLRAQIIRF